MNKYLRLGASLLALTLCGTATSKEAAVGKQKLKKEQSMKEKAQQDFDEIVYNWSQTFAEVLYTTKQKHYKASNIEDAFLNAIDAFISSQDPHSGLLKPDEYKNIIETTSGEFFGIGILIDNTRSAKEKFLTVIDTVPEGPADKAGLKAQDKILAINEETLEGMSTDKATAKLKGPRHTKVQLNIVRDNYPEPLAFDVARDVIKEQNSLGFYIADHNIYYLSLNMFSEYSIKAIEDLLKQATKKQSKGLILDLRNNSGGLLNAAIDIAGLFLEKNSLVVTTKDRNNKLLDEYRTNHKPLGTTSVPIFILVNNYTASAAEILAGSLKVHSDKLEQAADKKEQKKLNVYIIGTRTFGKGSVQEVIPISNNCAIKITMALYYLPDDTSIQGIGIEPDFVIEKKFPPSEQVQWFNKFYGREKSLTNSIKLTDKDKDLEEKDDEEDEEADTQERSGAKQKELEKKKPWAERTKDILLADSQFRETITLINILHNAQKYCPDNVCTRSKAIRYIKETYVTSAPLTLTEVKN